MQISVTESRRGPFLQESLAYGPGPQVTGNANQETAFDQRETSHAQLTWNVEEMWNARSHFYCIGQAAYFSTKEVRQ